MHGNSDINISLSPRVLFSQFLLLREQLNAVVDVNGLPAPHHGLLHALVIDTLLSVGVRRRSYTHTHSSEHIPVKHVHVTLALSGLSIFAEMYTQINKFSEC